ncbi:MAG: type II toxin-antitoxin system VapC family toxin [Chloroflexi bacterium]|nr:type II toxin-antitoxin system VapC family toxin [Chloroflexota bacterium]
MPNTVLIDTSALYAMVSRSDRYHERARLLYQALIDREDELLTTSYTLVESAALIVHRLGFIPFQALVDSIQPAVRIVWVDRLVHSLAWEKMVARKGNGLSLVDWTTAVVAQKYNALVFAFDEDFDREGLPVIR